VQHSKIGRSTSGVGQKQRGPSEPVAVGDGPPRQEPPAASTPLFWSTPGSRRRKGAEAAQSGWVAGSPWFCSGARRRGVSP
jgi:hypothetical protein